jgi:L-lactate dehydrogenase (cytochrome)
MASTGEWFETVAEAQRRARRRLPKSVYMALVAGSDRGITTEDNVAAFSELGFRPRIADLPQERSQTTTVMGQEIAFPVVISPTGVQAVDPEGEVAVARAAAGAGTAMGLSSFASRAVEDVAAANDKLFFQMYWVGTRERILQRAERAKAAGATAINVTIDWSLANGRGWGSPMYTEKI